MAFPITFWYGIRKEFISKERLEEAKEAGFNLVECDYDTDTNLQVLDWCAELGLKADVRDPRMNIALEGAEGWEAVLDGMIADYKDRPAVNRFFLRDEPVDDYFPTLGRVARYLHAHDPAHGEFINLLPHHAVPQVEGMNMHERYHLHLDRYIAEVEPTLLSYDHYNLSRREVESLEGLKPARISPENIERNHLEGKLFEAVNNPNFYDNLELMRAKSQEKGIPWMVIILLVEHWGYRWPTEAEIRWEAFTAFAYGSTALSYFTYWTPGINHDEPWSYHHGIILSDGTRGEKYEIVKGINTELQALHAALAAPISADDTAPKDPYRSAAVFHVGEEVDVLAKPFAGYGKLSGISVNDGEGRAVVGFFGENGDRFVVTNKDPERPLTLTFDASAPLYHFNKHTSAWEILNGAYTFAPGDGELFACGE